MNNQDTQRKIEKEGIKITKDRLIELIKKSVDKEFFVSHDGISAIVVIKTKTLA